MQYQWKKNKSDIFCDFFFFNGFDKASTLADESITFIRNKTVWVIVYSIVQKCSTTY